MQYVIYGMMDTKPVSEAFSDSYINFEASSSGWSFSNYVYLYVIVAYDQFVQAFQAKIKLYVLKTSVKVWRGRKI